METNSNNLSEQVFNPAVFINGREQYNQTWSDYSIPEGITVTTTPDENGNYFVSYDFNFSTGSLKQKIADEWIHIEKDNGRKIKMKKPKRILT